MTITIGAWAIPAIITVLAIFAALGAWPQSRGDFDFSPLFGCFFLAVAVIVSLFAWLVWALVA